VKKTIYITDVDQQVGRQLPKGNSTIEGGGKSGGRDNRWAVDEGEASALHKAVFLI